MITITKDELKILKEQIDAAINEILDIDEDMEKEGKIIHPVYRLTILKINVNKLIKGAEDNERAECEVEKAIRNIR